MKLIKKILGYCPYCQRYFVYPRTRRQITAYADDSKNFEHSCRRCFEDNKEYWLDIWDSKYY